MKKRKPLKGKKTHSRQPGLQKEAGVRSGSALPDRTDPYTPRKPRMTPEERAAMIEARERARRRKMMRRRRRLQTGSRILAALLIFLAVFFTVKAVFRVNFFTVRDLSGERDDGIGIYSTEEILRALELERGDNIFGFSAGKKVTRLEAELPLLQNISVERSLPSTVVVKAEPAQALYQVHNKDGWVVLSPTLKVIRVEDDWQDDLISLSGFEADFAVVGKELTQAAIRGDEAKEAAEICVQKARLLTQVVTRLEEEKVWHDVTELELEDEDELSFTYDDRIQVLLGTVNNLDYKLQLAGYLLRNDNGDALGDTDAGVLNCSHIQKDGTISPVFSPYQDRSSADEADEEQDEDGDNDPNAG